MTAPNTVAAWNLDEVGHSLQHHREAIIAAVDTYLSWVVLLWTQDTTSATDGRAITVNDVLLARSGSPTRFCTRWTSPILCGEEVR